MDLNTINKTANLSKNNSMSLMIFKLVNEHDAEFARYPFYAMNIFKIKEVLNATEYPITMSGTSGASFFKGVISVRGEYISVYDTAQWFGHEKQEPTDRSVIIVCEVNHQTIGLLVAYIHGVAEKDWKELQQTDTNARKIVSQTRIDDQLCLVMDIEQMVAEITGIDLNKESQVDSLGIKSDKVILFADDQPSIRGYVDAVMENLGLQHMVYPDGSGIIEFLSIEENRSRVGLVIIDLEMPNVSGHTVIRTIKEKMGLKIPVIVHSSMTVGDSVRQAKELGAEAFIGKINTKEIVSVIKKYFQP